MRYFILGVVACAFLSQCSVEGTEDPEAAEDIIAYTAIYKDGNVDKATETLSLVLRSCGKDLRISEEFESVRATGTTKDLVVASLNNICTLIVYPYVWDRGLPEGSTLVDDFNDWNISCRENCLRLKHVSGDRDGDGDRESYICYHQFAKIIEQSDDVRRMLISSLIYPSMLKNKKVWIKFEDLKFDFGDKRILPEYVRVSFECNKCSSGDISSICGPLYETVPCDVLAKSAFVKSGQTQGVTFRYKLVEEEYKLVQVFPTAWSLGKPVSYKIDMDGGNAFVNVLNPEDGEAYGIGGRVGHVGTVKTFRTQRSKTLDFPRDRFPDFDRIQPSPDGRGADERGADERGGRGGRGFRGGFRGGFR
jgi:hypothetical protein